MTRILVAILAVLFCGNAFAQNPRPAAPRLGPIGTAIEQKFEGVGQPRGGGVIQGALQDLADLLASDFAGADALSTAIPDLQDGNGQQCWRTMKSAGEVFKLHPIPATLKLATDIEAVRLLFMTANRICSSAQCTQVFADGANVVQALGPIPVMSLNAICSKIPVIASTKPTEPITPMPSSPAPSQQ